MITIINTSENMIQDYHILIHLVQMLVEYDQYNTQDVFDKFQSIIQLTDGVRTKLENTDREFSEVIKIIQTD